jgi:hypothetical protein
MRPRLPRECRVHAAYFGVRRVGRKQALYARFRRGRYAAMICRLSAALSFLAALAAIFRVVQAFFQRQIKPLTHPCSFACPANVGTVGEHFATCLCFVFICIAIVLYHRFCSPNDSSRGAPQSGGCHTESLEPG